MQHLSESRARSRWIEAKLRLAERVQRELTAAVKSSCVVRVLATRLALAELFRSAAAADQRRAGGGRAAGEARCGGPVQRVVTACQSIFRGRAARLARDAEVARRLGIRADAASTLCNFARNRRARGAISNGCGRALDEAREAAKNGNA